MSVLNGFVLTRQWRESPDGLQLIYWVGSLQGAQKIIVDQQETVAFFHASEKQRVDSFLSDQKGWRTRPLALASFYDQPVCALYCKSQKLLNTARERFEQQKISLWEADVRTVDRYLSERFITGDIEISSTTPSSFQWLNPRLKKAPRSTLELTMASLDIETSMDGKQLYSIAVQGVGGRIDQQHRVFMIGPSQNSGSLSVQWFDHEKDLLQAFLDWFAVIDPDVIVGWNVVNFDLRFLQRSCDRWRIAFTLGRNNEAPEWRQARDTTQHYFTLVPGRVVLDGIDTLKAATYHFESFSLEAVSRHILEKGKLIHDVNNRGHAITELFQTDKVSLAQYNLEDCRLVSEIFAHADLLNFAIERTRLTGLPMDKVGGSVAAFENLYLPRLHRAGYVAPNIGDVQSDIEAPGGFVMQSIPGMYDHVLVLDFKSLYPSIIRTFCIDPLSLLKGRYDGDLNNTSEKIFEREPSAKTCAQSDWIPGFNGAVFSKQHHLLPEIIRTLWQARDEAKKQKNAPLSQAIKIIMNSFYGVLGTPLCRFFDPLLSSSITLRGHDILQQTRILIEAEGHRVIYGDTDSVFVWLEHADSDNAAEERGRQLAEYLNGWWKDILHSMFGLVSCLEIEFETHYRKFFMPTMRGSDAGSKKRYAGLIGERLVFKGLEYVRTDWTAIARQIQYDVCWQIFHNEDPVPHLKHVVEQLLNGELDDQLVYRKRIRRRLQDYQRNIPPHAQAAKKADAWYLSQGQSAVYVNGGWVRYVMTLNGSEPVECASSPLDYDHYLTRQIAPAVDGLLQCLGLSLENIMKSQMSLF